MEKVRTNQKRSIVKSEEAAGGTRSIQGQSIVHIEEPTRCGSHNKINQDHRGQRVFVGCNPEDGARKQEKWRPTGQHDTRVEHQQETGNRAPGRSFIRRTALLIATRRDQYRLQRLHQRHNVLLKQEEELSKRSAHQIGQLASFKNSRKRRS